MNRLTGRLFDVFLFALLGLFFSGVAFLVFQLSAAYRCDATCPQGTRGSSTFSGRCNCVPDTSGYVRCLTKVAE